MNKIEKLQTKNSLEDELDLEWVELILEAIQLGLTQQEIREYLLANGPFFQAL
ncbi:anti-repressor SinI family protein [Bacillus sp. AK128]